MPSFRSFLFVIISTISLPVYARYEWVVVERGTYSGQGMDRDRWVAIDECAENMRRAYVAAAQRCCQNSDTEYPQYRGRCAGGASQPRSFSGGVAAYFCWPTPTRAEYFPATGYYWVYSERPFTCEELRDISDPAPSVSSTPSSSPVFDYDSSPTPTPSAVPLYTAD